MGLLAACPSEVLDPVALGGGTSTTGLAGGQGGSGGAGRTCGNGVCDEGEYFTTCPEDSCTCGNAVCDATESAQSCALDCSVCGDGVCTSHETPSTCVVDCGCGDGQCTIGEEDSCPSDCACDVDDYCADDENQFGCPDDCRAVSLALCDGEIPRACVTLVDGTARCWGGVSGVHLLPTAVAGLSNAVRIACADGTEHTGPSWHDSWVNTCALLDDGTLRCWGSSHSDWGSEEDYVVATPSEEPALSGVVALVGTSGPDWTPLMCAVVDTDETFCWRGWSPYTQEIETEQQSVPGVAKVVGVGGEEYARYAITTDGGLWCWGGYDGIAPTPLACPTALRDLSLRLAGYPGGWLVGCALGVDGSVWCVPTGDNQSLDCALEFVEVAGIADAINVAVGTDHACATRSDRTISCWGENEHGQLGDGTTSSSETPVQVVGITNAESVTAAEAGACALLADGTVWCWGANTDGRFGNGTTGDSLVPVPAMAW